MIAPLRDMDVYEADESPALSEAARSVVARLLPAMKEQRDETPAIPAWQAWLLVTWLVATALAYVAITLGLWNS